LQGVKSSPRWGKWLDEPVDKTEKCYELNELIVLHGNARDALNVTLAKLRQAQSEIAVLKEAAQQSVQADVCLCDVPDWQVGLLSGIRHEFCGTCGKRR